MLKSYMIFYPVLQAEESFGPAERIGKPMYDVIVIGGGASGMTAAVCAARNGKRVLLLEKNNKLGRKIAASGNGKCNLTNALISTECYHNAYPKELASVLNQCDREVILQFMKSLGIRCKEKKGYYYPMSEQAAVVVQMLQAELEHLKVTVILEERFLELRSDNGGFCVVTEKTRYHADKIILACGGMAAPKLGAENTGYLMLKKLGHNVMEPIPALVQMLAKERYIKKISGVRSEAKICLKTGERQYCEAGEIIFTDNGISGIPVFQLSRYVAESLNRGERPQLSVNLVPNCEPAEFVHEIREMMQYNPQLPVEFLFRGYCNHKVVYALLCESGLDAAMPCKEAKWSEIEKFIMLLFAIPFQITGTNGFEQAQVTRGGVPLYEINPDTMESKIIPGLYITGELLDIDGMCGGYNLHFAWATGMLAGAAVSA